MSLYGLIISAAILVCLLTAERIAKSDKKDSSVIWEAGPVLIITGVIGARVYHIINYLDYYSRQPYEILNFRNGGLGVLGAILGGLLGMLVYFHIKSRTIGNSDFMYWLGVAAVVLPLGQAVGRWGNFFNHEVYGLPTELPWGIFIEPEYRIPDFAEYTRFHPLFFYESVLNFLLFIILLSVRNKMSGDILAGGYLIGYSLIRFFLEFLRPESWDIYGFNVAQTLCVFISVLSLLYILFRYRNLLMRGVKG